MYCQAACGVVVGVHQRRGEGKWWKHGRTLELAMSTGGEGIAGRGSASRVGFCFNS